MFDYSDPTGTGLLEEQGVLFVYRILVDRDHAREAEKPSSAFTHLDAFEGVAAERATVSWIAFPRNVGATDEEIDRDRFRLQEEYVEWQVERDGGGRVERVTFTTLFPEWLMSLAARGFAAAAAGVRTFYPAADPTPEELFGPGFDPAAASPVDRLFQVRRRLPTNPWNDGTKGILCLSHPVNTLGALTKLLGDCAIAVDDVAPSGVCELVSSSGACVPGRNSDPNVCAAAQTFSRGGRALTLADPAGIHVARVGGIWKLAGEQIALDDPEHNRGLWRVTHGGHRAVLEVPPELTLVDDPVASGAQVATVVEVGSTVLHAAEADLPLDARTGFEFLRQAGG